MSKVPLNEKFDRVLRFLMSLRHDRVEALLRQRGFDTAEREHGWQLFETAAGRYLRKSETVAEPQSLARTLVDKIDAWENVWFDVADATLRNAFPAVHERLMANLSKTSGQQVVVTVGTLLRRLDAAEADAQREGEGELSEALALLCKRGLDEACRDQARQLITSAEKDSVLEMRVPDPDSVEQREAAIDEMWRWYQDWSQIARTVVTGKRERISMGLSTIGRPKKKRKPAPPPAPDVTPREPVAPAPPQPAPPIDPVNVL